MQSQLILGMTYAFAAAVQPGPLQAYLISQTLAHGWRRTAPAALAPLLSDLPIVCLVLLVLTRMPAAVVQGLQLGGGLFLVYLALGALKACRDYPKPQAQAAPPVHRTLLKAALVNLLNPSPYLGWTLVMGPLLLKAWHDSPAGGVALVAAFYLTLVLATLAIILLFGAARSLGPRVARLLVGLSALALAGIGLSRLWAGIAPLLP